MKEGKIPPELLRSLIFNNIKVRNEEVIMRPEIGEDCAAIDFESHACVLSTDPITGAVKNAGALAIHVSCNDVASCGVRPLGIMMTILAPPEASEEDIKRIMEEAGEAASKLGVEIIGGHTEITSAVNRIVISTTALGKVPKDRIVKSSGAKAGDDVIMTKWAGLEGTSIIAADKEKELEGFLTQEEIESAKSFIENISVVEEGATAGEFGASSMHDVTEGGILGAAWEITESSGKGIDIYIDKIPVSEITKKICGFYGIDPYMLISSGSMLITASKGTELVSILEEKGIPAVIIGRITEGGRNIIKNGDISSLNPPDVDELYKVLK
ncbi:MAG: AIR synthase family protein [Clostridiaceae bacterium]|nr:AIR synthase family protein [Clostridiaceae bacterium]